MSEQFYTVIGLWLDDEPLVAGVIEGQHGLVDTDPWMHTGENLQRWATSVTAASPDEAEANAVEEMKEGEC